MGNPGDSFNYVGNATKRLICAKRTLKMSGPGGASNAQPGPEQREPVREVHTMPDDSQYNDSAPKGKEEQSSNWKPVGILARALVEKAVAKCAK